jgi:murein DD-endopeptidase MepM/ murein hydrolase activator NlpD
MAENQSTLTAEETAYFESGGDAPLTAPEPENVEKEGLQTEAEDLTAPQEVAETEKARDEKGRFVPHQALHAEREEHKKTKAQLEEISRKQAILEDRWNTLLKAGVGAEQKPAEEDPEPDPNVDIFAHNAWLKRQIEKERSIRSEREEAEKQSRAAQEQEQAIWSEWHQSAQSYMAETPDFGEAVKFMSELRDRQLQALSFANPQLRSEQGRVQQINAELKQIVQAAKQQGLSPAEAVYQLAQGFGYQKAGQAPQPPQMPDKLASVARAQEASRTVGQAPGKAGGDELTLEGLLAMSPAEYDKWVQANPNKFRSLMGG